MTVVVVWSSMCLQPQSKQPKYLAQTIPLVENRCSWYIIMRTLLKGIIGKFNGSVRGTYVGWISRVLYLRDWGGSLRLYRIIKKCFGGINQLLKNHKISNRTKKKHHACKSLTELYFLVENNLLKYNILSSIRSSFLLLSITLVNLNSEEKYYPNQNTRLSFVIIWLIS